MKCSPILLDINKLLKNKLEAANHYALKSLASRSGISTEYEVLRKAASMRSLEQRRLEQSLVVLFKSLKVNGPKYISDFFNHRATRYNLRGTKNKLQQSTYNTLYKHNSLAYITSHLWNTLPANAQSSQNLKSFKHQLSKLNLFFDKNPSGYRCNRCIS